MGRAYEAFKRVNTTKRPESSAGLRLAVLASVMVAVVATWVGRAAPTADVVFALLALPIGAYVSHVRRDRDNTLIKLLLTIGAGLALSRFFGDVRSSVTIDDTREPLAALFLAVQVLHGFDLPARRDLGFTLASSLTLIALAGTATHAGAFGLLLAFYAVTAALSMAGMQRSAAREKADGLAEAEQLAPLRPRERRSGAAPRGRADLPAFAGAVAETGTGLLRAALPVLLVGTLVFLLLPRADQTRLAGLPFEGFPSFQVPGGAAAGVFNPGLQDAGRQQPSDSVSLPFNTTSYFGFAEHVDLRTVGQLSDEPIMRVRADRPRFWRGIVFDVYDGHAWSRSAEEPTPLYGTPVRLVPPDAEHVTKGRTVDVVQTFELLGDTPNLVFGAADAREVWIAGASATPWSDGTITTSNVQETETIYSVISEVNVTEPALLREAAGQVPASIAARYTQLPVTLPQRVHDLADDLTREAPTAYAKAEAVEAWIAENTEYSLTTAPPPLQQDTVDHFLFDSRQGWCEPIAASMVVLLRSAGVPARFATGFQPGDRNPLTGVWDVKMSQAHAWVEVWVPEYGWIAFDPTQAVPEAVDGRDTPTVPLFDLLGVARDRLVALTPEPVRAAVASVAAAARANPVPAALLVLAGLGVGAGTAIVRRREAAAARAGTTFDRLASLLADHGVPRDGWQTPREYIERVVLRRPDLARPDLQAVLAVEEARRYEPVGPTPERERLAEEAVGRLRARLLATAD